MEVERISVSIKRDVRLAKYNVPSIKTSFTAKLSEGEDEAEAFDELHALCDAAADEMVKLEIERHKESKGVL